MSVIKSLSDNHVRMEAVVLCMNIVTGGDGESAAINYTHDQIAWATIQALRRSVPPALPGQMTYNSQLKIEIL